ncbi:hypothetical protein BC828DRAFT_383432 [Blastocladiella britannica]|nr:hypothetical protein BC828DRAFT_383432 [Blastocladiella britannica]
MRCIVRPLAAVLACLAGVALAGTKCAVDADCLNAGPVPMVCPADNKICVPKSCFRAFDDEQCGIYDSTKYCGSGGCVPRLALGKTCDTIFEGVNDWPCQDGAKCSGHMSGVCQNDPTATYVPTRSPTVKIISGSAASNTTATSATPASTFGSTTGSATGSTTTGGSTTGGSTAGSNVTNTAVSSSSSLINSTNIIAGVAVIALLVVGVYFYRRRHNSSGSGSGKRPSPPKPTSAGPAAGTAAIIYVASPADGAQPAYSAPPAVTPTSSGQWTAPQPTETAKPPPKWAVPPPSAYASVTPAFTAPAAGSSSSSAPAPVRPPPQQQQQTYTPPPQQQQYTPAPAPPKPAKYSAHDLPPQAPEDPQQNYLEPQQTGTSEARW